MPVYSAPPPSSCWNYGAFVEGATALRWSDASSVTILKKTEATRTVNGYTDNVYRVRLAGKEVSVWGGELAQAGLVPSGEKRTLLVRVVGTGQGKLRQVEARLFPGGNTLRFSPIEVQDSARFGYSLRLSTTDGHGLRSVERLFRLNFTYEACDYPNGEVILLQRGAQLVFGLRALSSRNETGSVIYKLVFPRDKGGRPNQVRQVETLTERSESGKLLREKTRVKTYRWSGERMVE